MSAIGDVNIAVPVPGNHSRMNYPHCCNIGVIHLFYLAVILIEQNRLDEVRKILDLGCDKSEAFIRQARPLYKNLRQKKAASKGQSLQSEATPAPQCA